MNDNIVQSYVQNNCEAITDEDLHQTEKVTLRLIQHVNNLSHGVEKEYLRKKWIKNPDGSAFLSAEECAINTSMKLHKDNSRFDSTVETLKLRETELKARIVQKLKLLN